MALSVVNSTSAANNSANTVVTSAGISITAGNLIVVGIANFDSSNVNADVSVTDSVGNTYTKIGTGSTLVGNSWVTLYYAKNCIGGASVTFTYTATTGHADYPRILVIQIAGADTTAPLDQSGYNSNGAAGTTITSPSLTTTSASQILIAVGGDSGSTGTEAWTDGGAATGGWTLAQSQTATGAGMSASLAYAIVSATGAFAATMTTSASQTSRMVGLATFKAAAAGPALAAGTLSAGATGATTQALSLATNSGGTAPYSNQLQVSTNGGTTWTNSGAPVAGATANWTVTGLTPGQAYVYRAVVTDSAGTPATANSNTVSITQPITTITAPSGAGQKLLANQTNVVVELSGAGYWAAATTFSVAGLTGTAVTSKTFIDASHYRLYLTTSTVDASGNLTITNNADASSGTIPVVSSTGGAAVPSKIVSRFR